MNEPGNCGEIKLSCTNSRKELRRNCSPIGNNNTKHLIFCAQSGANILLTVWKWSGDSRYPGALLPMLENFRRAFLPGPTDCPWVSEDVVSHVSSAKVSPEWRLDRGIGTQKVSLSVNSAL